MVLRTLLVFSVLVAVLVSGVVTVIAWLNRRQPGIYWFSVHAGVTTLWSLTALNSFVADSESVTIAFGMITSSLTLLVTVAWFLFIIEYLGYRNRPSRRTGQLLCLGVGVIYPLLYASSPATGLLVVETTQWNGVVVFDLELTLLRAAIIAFGLSLIIFSLGLLVRAAVIEDRLHSAQAVILGVAVVIPLLNGLATTLVTSLPTGVPISRSTIVLSTVLYVFAFVRYDLFTLAPATGRIGIRRAFESLGAGVVVSGVDDRILEANASASDILGDGLVGRQLGTVFERLGIDESTLPATVQHSNRWYWITASPITEDSGTEIGRSVLLLDITDRRLREQRLDVLDRILRHNLRNQLDVVHCQIELLEREIDDPALLDSLTLVDEATEALLTSSNKARQFEVAMQDISETSTVDVRTLLEAVVDELATDPETVDIDTDPGLTVQTNWELLHLVCLNLVENAVVHNDSDDPRVEVTGSRQGEAVRISVADNGPGIPDAELAALENGAETALTHSSGLGLWIVSWATRRLGGAVEFSETGSGAAVEITVPDRADAPPREEPVALTEQNSE